MSDALSQMIVALGLETGTIRKKGGGTQIELRGGEHAGAAEGSHLYRFLVGESPNLRDDTPVRVKVGQEDVSGILVSFRDGVLVVALEKDLGPTIAAARLVTNDAFLLERLAERLQQVQRGEAVFDREAAERVLGVGPVRTADSEPSAPVLSGSATNPEQALAVRRSLGSETLFVWGPPGTGKTTTLARIVEAHYRAGRSVLLVSNTNIAVDTALERVAERLADERDFQTGLVLRQGPVVKEELRERFGEFVIPEEVASRLGASLRQEQQALLRENEPLVREQESLREALTRLEKLQAARGNAMQAESALVATREGIETAEAEAVRALQQAESLRSAADQARNMGAIRRFFTGTSPERLERDAQLAEAIARRRAEQAATLTASLAEHEAKLHRHRSEVERLTLETKSYPAATVLGERLLAIALKTNEIRTRLSSIDRELAEFQETILGKCRVLATTVYRTYLGKKAARQFDTVVIDEASMLMPPLVYYVAGLSRGSVIVAGDFRQLPPIVLSEEAPAREWLKQDVFEKAGIPGRLVRREDVPHLVALGTQYRMDEPICSVVNDLFYFDHPLQTSRHPEEDAFPLDLHPLLYVDTAAFHPWTALRVGTWSRYNLLHALLARNIVLHLAETGYLPPSRGSNGAVGVVAPYSAQAQLVQALLEDRLGQRAGGLSATVHRFQGNEKRSMIIDLPDSLGVPLSRFMEATRIEQDGARLLNVAVSRARDHVILIANFEHLRAKAPADGFVRRLLDLFAARGRALDLGQVLPLAQRDWIDGLHKVFPASFELPSQSSGAFSEGTFYPAFVTDLARAEKSIVILSPFATGAGTARWMDLLRAARMRGVQVRIVTRPANEGAGDDSNATASLLEAIRNGGIAVDLRARMHEKVAIIDGRILWHGSLNILSHRDTHESMLRIDSLAACDVLARFVTSPTGRREEAPGLVTAENPACPKCERPTVWNSGRYGIYFECEDNGCDGRVDARKGSRASQARSQDAARPPRALPRNERNKDTQLCPRAGCGGRLARRNGRFGPFLGCTNYPACRYTVDLN